MAAHSAKLKIMKLYLIMGAMLISAPAFANPDANTVVMPWEGPLSKILESLRGNTAKTLITLAIVACGLGFAFGEQGSGFKKLLGIALGGALTVGAVAFVSTLLGATF